MASCFDRACSGIRCRFFSLARTGSETHFLNPLCTPHGPGWGEKVDVHFMFNPCHEINWKCGCNGLLEIGVINSCKKHKAFWKKVEVESNKHWNKIKKISTALGKAAQKTMIKEAKEIFEKS